MSYLARETPAIFSLFTDPTMLRALGVVKEENSRRQPRLQGLLHFSRIQTAKLTPLLIGHS